MPLNSKEIKIPLHKGVRPIFSLKTLGGELDCHVDTGSLLPIWFSSERSLTKHFEAKRTNYYLKHRNLYKSIFNESPL